MVIQIMATTKGKDLTVADKKLKNKQVELLKQGLQPLAQAPDTITAEQLTQMLKEKDIEHEC